VTDRGERLRVFFDVQNPKKVSAASATRTSAPDRLRERDGAGFGTHQSELREGFRPDRVPVMHISGCSSPDSETRGKRLRPPEARSCPTSVGAVDPAPRFGAVSGAERSWEHRHDAACRARSVLWGRQRGCATASKDLGGERSPGRTGRSTHRKRSWNVTDSTAEQSLEGDARNGSSVRRGAGNGGSSSHGGRCGPTSRGQRPR